MAAWLCENKRPMSLEGRKIKEMRESQPIDAWEFCCLAVKLVAMLEEPKPGTFTNNGAENWGKVKML